MAGRRKGDPGRPERNRKAGPGRDSKVGQKQTEKKTKTRQGGRPEKDSRGKLQLCSIQSVHAHNYHTTISTQQSMVV